MLLWYYLRWKRGKEHLLKTCDPKDALLNFIEPVVQDDNEAMLNKLLGMLSLEYKICLILREIRGLSYKEISAVLKIPELKKLQLITLKNVPNLL